MLEIRTTTGDYYLVMGQRVLRNQQRMKFKECPVVLWVGCCNRDGSAVRKHPCRGKNLCIKFNSGLFVGGIISDIKETC